MQTFVLPWIHGRQGVNVNKCSDFKPYPYKAVVVSLFIKRCVTWIVVMRSRHNTSIQQGYEQFHLMTVSKTL